MFDWSSPFCGLGKPTKSDFRYAVQLYVNTKVATQRLDKNMKFGMAEIMCAHIEANSNSDKSN